MWKENKKSEGYREINAWLAPDALAALDAIKPVAGKVAVGDLIGAAIIQAAGSGWRYGADADNQAVPTDMTKALAALTARVERLEAGDMAPEVPVDAETPTKPHIKGNRRPPGAPWPAKPRKGADLSAIAKAVAERRTLLGDDFNRSELYRELLDAGVKVHASASSFCDAVSKLLARRPGTA